MTNTIRLASRPAIILEGQVYYEEQRNVYLVVTKRNGDMVRYAGPAQGQELSFRGILEDEMFIHRFQPVDPADLTQVESAALLSLCQPNTKLKTGYIKED